MICFSINQEVGSRESEVRRKDFGLRSSDFQHLTSNK